MYSSFGLCRARKAAQATVAAAEALICAAGMRRPPNGAPPEAMAVTAYRRRLRFSDGW